MNRQEAFDKMASHMLKQNAQSIDGERGCVYRHPAGLMCPVGCLIKDEFYKPSLENLPADDSNVAYALELSGVEMNVAMTMMLDSVQLIHDYESPSTWRACLAEYAVTNNLSTQALGI